MNHAGEITPLTRLVRPHVAIVTTVEPVHLEFFSSVAAIADAKAEIFLGLEPGGAALLNRDNPHYQRLKRRAAEAGVSRILSFGENARADARLVKCALQATGSTVEASILVVPVAYKVGAPGKHLVMNSLAVLAAASLAGADLARAALALARQAPAADAAPASRSNCRTVRRSSSTRATTPIPPRCAPRWRCSARRRWPGRRRIAVLGDMLNSVRPGRTCIAAWSIHRRERSRSRLLRRPADGLLVAGSSIGLPGRLCE